MDDAMKSSKIPEAYHTSNEVYFESFYKKLPTLNGRPIDFSKINIDVNAPENKEFMEEAVKSWRGE